MRIRYYGHIGQDTGYGRAATDLAAALRTAGHEVAAIPLVTQSNMLRRPWLASPDVSIVHTLPVDCAHVIDTVDPDGDVPAVAVTTIETRTVDAATTASLRCFDQVWVPNRGAAITLASYGSNVRAVPHCYDDSIQRQVFARPDHERFRFYWIGAWTARKNPAGLIRAFAYAFTNCDPVELVLHSPGCKMEAFVGALAQTGLSRAELPTIVLSNEHVPSLDGLHGKADCFVTAARGEAWNLPAFDAMLSGRHVIAQAGLGSDDYLLETSAELITGWEAPAQVDVALAASRDGTITGKKIGAQGLSSRTLWLEPDLVALADAMRRAAESRTRTITINYDPAERFGYAAVGRIATKALEEL